jgi:hypothetical protein
MNKILISLLCFLLFSTPLISATSIRTQVEAQLPSELVSLSSKNLRTELEAQMTSKLMKKSEADALYLKYFEDKNDVTIGFKNNHVEYIYVEVPKSLVQKMPNLYQEVLNQLSKAQMDKIAKDNQADKTHESGRYILLDLPEEKIKLEFYNNEKKELRSIVLYTKNTK